MVQEKPAVLSSGLFLSVIPANAGIQALNGPFALSLSKGGCIACSDVVNGFDAASRAAAGYLSLLVQRKVTQRKHAPEPPTPVPCRDAQMPRSAWMRVSGRFSPRPGASRTRRARQ